MDKNWLVIEVDSDIDMLSWKHRVLENAKYKPTCKVATVEADVSVVSKEWGSKIVKAGLKPELPSVWVLEGLMEYLNPDVHFNVFETVRQKCSPGSSIVLSCLTPKFGKNLVNLGLKLPYQPLVPLSDMKHNILKAGFHNLVVHNQEELQHHYGRILPQGFTLIEAHVTYL